MARIFITGSLRDIDWSERRWNPSQAYSDSKPPAKPVEDPVFQDQLAARLAEMTGVSLF